MVVSRRGFAKLAGVGAASLAFGGVLSACSNGGADGSEGAVPDAGSGSTQTSDQVIVAMPTTSEPAAGFDPLIAWGCGEHVHEPLIQSTLITTDADLGFKNDLATSYEASADGLTWTFGIRNDVRFSDGQLLTARDVAFTINGIVNSDASECDLSMVKEAVATDDATVEIRLGKPFNALLYTLAVVGIVPEHAYGSDYGANPIGSGRYVLEQWDRGQQAIFVANPDYYGEAPKMQRVVVVFMAEDAALAAAKSGQVDVAYTAATFAASQPAGYDLLTCESVDSRGISLPVVPAGATKREAGVDYAAGNDVTCDVAVRRAINCGIDRTAMISHVLNGYGQEAFSVGDGLPWSSSDMRCETDKDVAAELLAQAGWQPAADGVREKGGVRASFDLYYAAGDSVRQALAAEFAEQMSELGLEVNIKGASWDDIYPHQFSAPVLWGWGANSPMELYNLHHSEGTGNYACMQNPAVDAHFDAALAAPSVEESFAQWQQAQWDGEAGIAPQGDAPWVWLANVDHLYFVRENLLVADQKPHPHGHGWSLVNNVDQWAWA